MAFLLTLDRLTLRGPILFEGLFNPRIRLSREEWREHITEPVSGYPESGLTDTSSF